jgi:hypothetical protein
MEQKIKNSGANALWSLHSSAKEVWHLLKVGVDLPLSAGNTLEQDLRNLAAPHMAVLVHKRAKMARGNDSVLQGAWLMELSAFAERVGRYLAAELAEDRRHIVGLLDDIIASEQEKFADAETGDAAIPLTSRFDMCWAR